MRSGHVCVKHHKSENTLFSTIFKIMTSKPNYLSNVKMSNTWSMEEVNKKKKLDIMRLRYDEVNFEVRFDDHQNTTKCS